MPWAASKLCPRHGKHTEPRCPRCEAERKAEFDRSRATAAERGYDAAWRKVRKQFLEKHPCCEVCGQPATEVDHIRTVKERPDLRLSWSNLRPLCKAHHSARTARDQGFARRQGDRGSGFSR